MGGWQENFEVFLRTIKAQERIRDYEMHTDPDGTVYATILMHPPLVNLVIDGERYKEAIDEIVKSLERK
jgi:hypothetical protein